MRWTSGVLVDFCLLVCAALLSRCTSTSYEEYLEHAMRPRDEPVVYPGITCDLDSKTACPADHCCVKEVISFEDLDRDIDVRTKCQPFRSQGELCLRDPEDYLCPCALGLRCEFLNDESYGHCVPSDHEEDEEGEEAEEGERIT